MTTEQQHYTPDEVAAAYRVKRQTVATWCREGRIKAFKTPAGRWLIVATEEVRRTIERHSSS